MRCHAGDKKRGDRHTYICTCIHTHIEMDPLIGKSSPIHFRTYEIYRNTFPCSEITEHIVLFKRTEMSVFLSNKQGFVVKGLLFLLSMVTGQLVIAGRVQKTPGKCYCQDFQWTLRLFIDLHC